MSQQILFEQPLNDRIRLLLRLEHFFAETESFIKQDEPIVHQGCLFALAEILTILSKNEFRSELIKELEKNVSHLSQFISLPSVDQQKLQSAISETQSHLNFLYQQAGQFQKLLPSSDLLNNIKQRINLVSYPCHLDIAGATYWINQPQFVKQQQLNHWLSPIKPIHNCITMLLDHIRSSAIFENQSTHKGFFQRNLEMGTTYQLVRILAPQSIHAYPEITGGKHRVHVRFLSLSEQSAKAESIQHTVDFHIAFCKV